MLLFIGLTDEFESEGFDRRHLGIPALHTKLVDAVTAVNENVIVALSGGSAIEMPWANKVKGIRAAVCSDCATARLVKEHNNANILAFGARIVGVELAKDICDAYLNAEFEGDRHNRRIDESSFSTHPLHH